MGFQYDWNREILAQFHATFFHDVANETIHWMIEGVHYKVDFTTFARLLGFGSGDRYADTIQTENVMKAEDIVFAYERRDLANGKQ